MTEINSDEGSAPERRVPEICPNCQRPTGRFLTPGNGGASQCANCQEHNPNNAPRFPDDPPEEDDYPDERPCPECGSRNVTLHMDSFTSDAREIRGDTGEHPWVDIPTDMIEEATIPRCSDCNRNRSGEVATWL